MSGVGEILAITSLVIQVIGSVEKVIAIFDRVQNAPDELNQFRVSLSRLSRHFTALQAEMKENESVVIDDDDLHDIGDTLELCQKMFDEYDASLHEPGIRNAVHRATWAPRHTTKLARYQGQIDRLYQQVILPLWLSTLSAKNKGKATEDLSNKSTESGHSENRSAVAIENIIDLERGIARLQTHNNRAQAERTLQGLDQTLRKCWTQLGISVEDMYENLGILDPTRTSIVDLPFETAPTILKLEITPEVTQKIVLERVHVMARDDQTRIILYQNTDASVKVTHIIPYGCIPWTPRKTSRTVSFLNQHTVTVIDDEGHHIYHIDPKYRFKDDIACQKFQKTIRERKHLGAFDAVEVTSNGETLSCGQVIRFWRKTGNKTLVTMTFLATSIGDGCGHKELNLERYRQEPVFVLPKLKLLKKAKESDTVDLRSDSPRRNIRIKFDAVDDTKDFRDFFIKVHPINKEPFESEQNQMSSTAPGILDTPSELALQPELSYGPSSASASSNTPAATPLDVSWGHDEKPPTASYLNLDSKYPSFWMDVFTPADAMSTNNKEASKKHKIPRKPIQKPGIKKEEDMDA